MKALITGASSGLGRDMAHILSEKGYDIIAVARREDRLKSLAEELKTDVEIIVADVTDTEQCKKLAERAGEVDILINNAGFGVFGDLCSNDLDTELDMINTNICALHILTKRVNINHATFIFYFRKNWQFFNYFYYCLKVSLTSFTIYHRRS